MPDLLLAIILLTTFPGTPEPLPTEHPSQGGGDHTTGSGSDPDQQ